VVQTAVFNYVQEERTEEMILLQDVVVSLGVVVAVKQAAPPRGAVSAKESTSGMYLMPPTSSVLAFSMRRGS
jgi:hypothetical protein